MSRQSEFDNVRAEKIRVERLSRKDFIDADLVHLDDAKRLAIELCLAAEQDANLGVHDQSVHIRAGAQQMERGIKSLRLDDMRQCGDKKGGPKTERMIKQEHEQTSP